MLMILLVPLIGLCGSIGLHFSAFWLGPEIRRVVVSVCWLRWQWKSWISQVHRLHRLHRPIFSQKMLVGNGGYTDHPTWTIDMMLQMSAIRNHEHGSQLCTRIEVSSHQHTIWKRQLPVLQAFRTLALSPTLHVQGGLLYQKSSNGGTRFSRTVLTVLRHSVRERVSFDVDL